MSQPFEEYCRQLQDEANVAEQTAQADVRLEHLHAFNFGRSLGRTETARAEEWARFRWLMLGAALGLSAAAIYIQVFLSARVLQFLR